MEKIIGKRRSLEGNNLPADKILQQADQWLKSIQYLRYTKKVCPKGLFKFKTFEEADQWMEAMISRSSRGSRQSRIW